LVFAGLVAERHMAPGERESKSAIVWTTLSPEFTWGTVGGTAQATRGWLRQQRFISQDSED
jgi:hypothetical protein